MANLRGNFTFKQKKKKSLSLLGLQLRTISLCLCVCSLHVQFLIVNFTNLGSHEKTPATEELSGLCYLVGILTGDCPDNVGRPSLRRAAAPFSRQRISNNIRKEKSCREKQARIHVFILTLLFTVDMML